jgi:hypothetical protein
MALDHGPKIVTNGLVFNLDAADRTSYPGSGTTWSDISGYRANSTLVNGPTYSSLNFGSIAFDGVNDYATTYTTPTLLQGDPSFTVCSWMKRTGDGGVNTGTWGLSGDGNGINSWWQNNSNEISIDTWGQATFTTGVTYPLNEWVFVAWQKIAGNMTRANCILWRNLVSYTGNQLTILRPEAGPPSIGNNGINIARISQTYSTPTPIQVAKFWIYNRILSPLEIAQNYNVTKGRFGL